MVGEVGPKKVAEDGRPRAVTKLLKWNRYAQGKLESPTNRQINHHKTAVKFRLRSHHIAAYSPAMKRTR